jgi:DnaJ-class molecular chaperone
VKIDDAVRAFRAFGIANADTLAPKELNAIRKRLALRYHPDKSPNGDGSDFTLINQAYYVLLRQKRRS